MAVFNVLLHSAGAYSYSVLDELGNNVMTSQAQVSPLVATLTYTAIADGKLHIYRVIVKQPGCPDTILGFVAAFGQLKDAFVLTPNTKERCQSGLQYIDVSVGGGISNVGTVSYRVWDVGTGRKLLEQLNQAYPFTLRLNNLTGRVLVTATGNRGTAGTDDDVYAASSIELSGCGSQVIDPPTTSSLPSTNDDLLCALWVVRNDAARLLPVSYINCAGEYKTIFLNPTQTINLCVREGQIFTEATLSETITPCSADTSTSSAGTTSSAPAEYIGIDNTTHVEWTTGAQYVRVFISYAPSSLSPFDVQILRAPQAGETGAQTIGSLTNATYSTTDGLLVSVLNGFVGPVTVRVSARRGDNDSSNDLIATKALNLTANPNTTSSAPASSTTSSGAPTLWFAYGNPIDREV